MDYDASKHQIPTHVTYPDYNTENFVLTLTYTWHMSCKWYTSQLMPSTMTFKNSSHHSTKAFIPAWNKSMSSLHGQEMFHEASVAHHVPTRGLIRGPKIEKSLGPKLPTRFSTGCSSTDRRSWMTFPELENESTMILQNIRSHSPNDNA